MQNSTYLFKRLHTFYFRCRIPADLLALFPCREFKRSLKTSSLTSARKLLKAWCSKCEDTYTLLRSGVLTTDQAKTLAAELVSDGSRARRGNAVSVKDVQDAIGTLQKYQLSKLVESYIEEYKATEKADGPSIYEIETKCWMFTRIVGDVDIRAISRDTILDFLRVLKLLPRNMCQSALKIDPPSASKIDPPQVAVFSSLSWS